MSRKKKNKKALFGPKFDVIYNMKKYISYLLGCIILSSCTSKPTVLSPLDIKTSYLIGNWEYQAWDEGIISYKRVKKLSKKVEGFQFSPNGDLKIVRNAGWCGTPPISYGTFKGRWKQEGNKILLDYPFINIGGDGTVGKMEWIIIKKETDYLQVKSRELIE